MATITTNKTARSLIARGTPKTAFTQLTGCAVTRSGTTATLTKASHGLSNGNIVCIRGFELEEFNGVFTIANVATDTFEYTIFQDPGANPAGTPGTVDLAIVSSILDLSTAYGAVGTIIVQNAGTAPTVAPIVGLGHATANSSTEGEYLWTFPWAGSKVNSLGTNIPFQIDGGRYWKFAVFGNTGQPVDVTIQATELTSQTVT